MKRAKSTTLMIIFLFDPVCHPEGKWPSMVVGSLMDSAEPFVPRVCVVNVSWCEDRCSCETEVSYYYRVLKGGCPRGGGNWGTLRIPREDWGT